MEAFRSAAFQVGMLYPPPSPPSPRPFFSCIYAYLAIFRCSLFVFLNIFYLFPFYLVVHACACSPAASLISHPPLSSAVSPSKPPTFFFVSIRFYL